MINKYNPTSKCICFSEILSDPNLRSAKTRRNMDKQSRFEEERKGRVKSRHTAHEPKTRRMYNCGASFVVIALCTLRMAGKRMKMQWNVIITEGCGFSDTLGNWQRCHYNIQSPYPHPVYYMKGYLRIAKTVAVIDRHSNCCHHNHNCLYCEQN